MEYYFKYENEKYKANYKVIEEVPGTSVIEISSIQIKEVVYLISEKGKYICTIPEREFFSSPVYSENLSGLSGTLTKELGNRYEALCIAEGIDRYYRDKGTLDIEQLIYRRRKNMNNPKVQFELYDADLDLHYFVFSICKEKDSCVLMCEPTPFTAGFCELYEPMISQLNYYYGNCYLISESEFTEMDYRKVKKRLEEEY